ncbi:MAG TPA: hypothetical protein VNF48_00990 [Gammaproteobacteria bacterium]|nr:hypothetical protein [Gammaproteobacteria bacterium]
MFYTSPAEQTRKTYIILPGNKGITPDDLQFQEYASELTRALQIRGFAPANAAQDADMIIVLSYGIGNPQSHEYSYVMPMFGQTGISSSYTSGVINSYGSTSSYSGSTTYVPSYGITGYVPTVSEYTTYFRFAIITAYDPKALEQSHTQMELWQTTITSTGSSGDLRRIFPILIASGEPYFTTNTGQQVHRTLYENDDMVLDVKGTNIKKK